MTKSLDKKLNFLVNMMEKVSLLISRKIANVLDLQTFEIAMFLLLLRNDRIFKANLQDFTNSHDRFCVCVNVSVCVCLLISLAQVTP